jgi:hypothetical protein
MTTTTFDKLCRNAWDGNHNSADVDVAATSGRITKKQQQTIEFAAHEKRRSGRKGN